MSEATLLLDTHVWLWLALGQKGTLTPQAIRAIDEAAKRRALAVSIISIWEIALLEARQRIALPLPVGEWITRALEPAAIRLLALDRPATVVYSCRLPGDFHADPADRLLVATARAENAVLVTRDRKILDYSRAGHVRVMAV